MLKVRILLVVLCAVLGTLGATVPTAAQGASSTTTAPEDFAPLDAAPPALTIEEPLLGGSLECPDLDDGDAAVLLLHGTGGSASTTFDVGWRPALADEGFAVCTIELLGNGLVDAQLSAERVVHAIRTIHAAVGEPLAVVGYSQGGAVARFALRFWSDLRPMVEDLVLIASPAVGTVAADALCTRVCPAAVWQLRSSSSFIAASNSGGFDFPGIDVTSVTSTIDRVAVPPPGTAARGGPGARDVQVQDVCADNASTHLQLGTVDPVAYALALDAITHPGQADPARLPAAVCDRRFLPGVDEAAAERTIDALNSLATRSYRDATLVSTEPDLRCFVTATCAGGPGTGGGDDREPRSGGGVLWYGALAVVVLGVVASVAAAVRSRRELARRRSGE